MRRLLSACLGLLLLTAPATATWSIVVYNRVTGECGVAVASCVPGFAVGPVVPIVVVGQGAGATQAAIAPGSAFAIRNGLQSGLAPADILAGLSQGGSWQYGICGAGGPPVGFTGANNFAAALHVTGQVGDWDYAIQGNILTGDAVVLEAEQALLAVADQDAAILVTAALEAGRQWGGDGRCSCSPSLPTSCGSPPLSFTHTATSAFVVVARLGDTDGGCATASCSQASFYLREQYNTGSQFNPPVPIVVQRVRDALDAELGRPDHYLSTVDPEGSQIQAGFSAPTFDVLVQLRDRAGDPLPGGGASFTASPSGIAFLQGVTDHGAGMYTLEVSSTFIEGSDTLRLTVDDGNGPRELLESIPVSSIAPEELHAWHAAYSVAEGTRVPFSIDRGPADAGASYHLLGSASGTMPGTAIGALQLPLNRDRFLGVTYRASGAPPYTGFVGALDGQGRGEMALEYQPGTLAPLVGTTLHLVALIDGQDLTNVVEVLVEP